MSWRPILILPALLLAAPGLPGVPATKAEAAADRPPRISLCEPSEAVLFECRSGDRLVALCGGRTPAPYAHYLFGMPGQIEYRSPPGATFTRPPAAGVDIRFSDGEDEYSIYRGTVTGMSADGRYEPASIDGVRVRRGGVVVSDRRCSREAHSEGPLETYLPRENGR